MNIWVLRKKSLLLAYTLSMRVLWPSNVNENNCSLQPKSQFNSWKIQYDWWCCETRKIWPTTFFCNTREGSTSQKSRWSKPFTFIRKDSLEVGMIEPNYRRKVQESISETFPSLSGQGSFYNNVSDLVAFDLSNHPNLSSWTTWFR